MQATRKMEAYQFPPQNQNGGTPPPRDVYAIFNDLLDIGAIACVIQFKTLRFAVKHFYTGPQKGWLECVVDDEEFGPSDDIRIIIKEGLAMTVYVAFTN